MADEELPTVEEALAAALAAPKRVKGDAGEVEEHSLGEIVAAYKYAAAATAQSRGVKLTKLIPRGTV